MDKALTPPWPSNFEGAPRHIGLEVEFGQLSPQQAAGVMLQAFGGEVAERTTFQLRLTGTAFGGMVVELDTRYAEGGKGETKPAEVIREGLVKAASAVVPTEIAVDPVEWTRVLDLDRIIAALRQAGAVGTSEHLAYGFGLQLNVETPSRRIEEILPIFQAYLILCDDLRQSIGMDFTRTMLPFVQRFPDSYVDRVLDPAYRPDLDAFITDYFQANPTKFRGLDLMPLLAWLDPPAVERALGREPDAMRPAFHYRLPNTRLEDPSWGVSREWRRWLQIEQLASRPRRLRQRLKQHRRARPSSSVAHWARKLSRVLKT